jgi:hypothetical protein
VALENDALHRAISTLRWDERPPRIAEAGLAEDAGDGAALAAEVAALRCANAALEASLAEERQHAQSLVMQTVRAAVGSAPLASARARPRRDARRGVADHGNAAAADEPAGVARARRRALGGGFHSPRRNHRGQGPSKGARRPRAATRRARCRCR